MTVNKTTGTLDLSKILKKISKNVGVELTKHDVKLIQKEVVIKFTKKNHVKAVGEVEQECSINQEEFLDYAAKHLRKKEVKASNITVDIQHVDGDCREPMDYGYDEVVGVKFEVEL